MKHTVYTFLLFMILIAATANASDAIASDTEPIDYVAESASRSLALELAQTASGSAELTDAQNASQTATMTASIPERIELPVNPWTGKNAVFLDKFLAQNWFIEAKLGDFRKLALAIIVAETENRKFRAETELLVRNAGSGQIYSALVIFPVLMNEQTALLKEAGINTAQQINNRSLRPEEGIKKLVKLVTSQLENVMHFERLIDHIRKICQQYATINNRKTRLSNLHNLLRAQKRASLEIFTGHFQRFEILIRKYRLKLEELKLKLEYLRNNNNNNRVLVASRLTELFRQCDQVMLDVAGYKERTLDFTVKLKNQLVAGREKLKIYADSVEQNRFHINESIGAFAKRDLNPQKTAKFSYKPYLHEIFTFNSSMFAELKDLALIEREQGETETYNEYLTAFNSDFAEFSEYKEFFDSLFNPELILEPVLEDIEKEEITQN